jgi:hypothetical protein
MAHSTIPATTMSKGDRLLLERELREAQKQAIDDELEERIQDHALEVSRLERARQFQKGAKRRLDFLTFASERRRRGFLTR